MKTITRSDLQVGNTLLCVFDANCSESPSNWNGELVIITRVSKFYVWCEVISSRYIGNIDIDRMINNPNSLVFVNYDEMTDKEKFIYALSGKVTID